MTVRAGRLSWREGDDGCHASVRIEYVRHLDPALWFGPVSALFMDAGASAFLAGLD